MPASYNGNKTDEELSRDELIEELRRYRRTIIRQKSAIARYEHAALMKRYPPIDREEERLDDADRGSLRDELDEALTELEAQNEELVVQNEELRVTNESLEATKESLRKSEAHLKKAEEIADMGHWEWDLKSGEVSWSESLYRVLGYPDSTRSSYAAWRSRLHPEDMQSVEKTISEAVRVGKAYHFDYRIIRPDGEVRYVNDGGRVLERDGAGNPTRYFGTTQDITERRRAEEERDRVFDYSMDLLSVVGLDGAFKRVSPSFKDILGWSEEEMIGRPITDFLHPDDRQSTNEKVKGHEQGELAINFENRYRCKDGSYKLISWNSSPLVDERIIIAVGRDITECKRADEALRERTAALSQSEERLRLMVDASPVPMVVFEGNRVNFINKEFIGTFGYTIEDIPTLDQWWPLAYPDEEYRKFVVRRWEAAIGPAIRDRTTAEPREVVVTCKNGSKKHVMSYFSSIGSLNLSAFYDITERKEAEEERERLLRQVADSEKRLESVIENMPAGVIIAIAPFGKVIMSNRQCEKILGHPNIYPDTISDYVGYRGFRHDGSRILPREWPMARSITQGEVVAGEEVIYRTGDGGKRCLLLYSSPIRDDRGEIVAGVVTFLDITQRKRDEKALVEAKAQAELYVDLLSHDINNFNHAAMGYLDLALEALEEEKRLRIEDKILIERPLTSLQNSSTLIENVRKLQQLMEGDIKTRPIDLGQVLKDIDVAGFKHNGREIAINIPAVQNCTVEANELLRDVFVNLITNSIKHSDEEKPLAIDVKIENIRDGGRLYCKCTVEDNGPGIPDELKPKLFHRFKRGATRAHGKGLGLYLIRTLVEGYDGRVWIEDRAKGDHTKGARFVVMLPIYDRQT